ncbi:MAG: TetR family transcriptional regulator C-terminal domain-containing protein [Microbacterium sp.]
MPKIVDKDERRAEFIEATWHVIQREGFAGVTLRSVAAECGYAHGAIRHFFSSKAELLAAAFELAEQRTVDRATAAAAGKRGLDGLRAWCEEIMPIDDDKIVEARVVLAFWEDAVANESARITAQNDWQERMAGFLRQAREDGEVRTGVGDQQILDVLSAVMAGLQVHVLLAPDKTTRRRQLDALEGYLRLLA